MRIKFLSILTSLFMASFVVTACLDDDNNIEYSADATIQAFELDAIYGVNYKFTIDQIRGRIYNADSLPVHADTIVDKILVKKISTASSIITMKNKDGQDSVLLCNGSELLDSIDFRKPVELKVYAPNMVQTKSYVIDVRIHRHDPDSMRWDYRGKTNDLIEGRQKAVILKNEILNYTVVNSRLVSFRRDKNSQGEWKVQGITFEGFNHQLPTSILSYQDKLYATSATNDGKVYESTDGISWTVSTLFGDSHVSMLLAPLSNKITFIKEINDKGVITKYFDSTDQIAAARSGQTATLQVVPENFPTSNLSYTIYETATGLEGVALVGQHEKPATITDGSEITLPWGYMGGSWTAFMPNNKKVSCAFLENPSILYYNERFYIFGDKFESFYTSQSGLTWEKANDKFAFPKFNWKAAENKPTQPSINEPEFRGRRNYTMVCDKENQYIYVLFAKGTKVQADGKPYIHEAEAWRGRLNKLWFELANK